MSLYLKEKPEFVEKCFQSLLEQTLLADEWVIVEDGPLSEKMHILLDRYEKLYPNLIKRVVLKQNYGLGIALQIGILACKNEIIARMDTDDIARKDRFEKQFKEFNNDDELDICGSYIDEFEKNQKNIVAMRKVPLIDSEIKKYQKKRDAFNHMTVMYKKSAVLKAGNYQHCPLMEDTLLWANMLQNGAKCKNIGDSLVYVRIGDDMYKRRGGWEYFFKYKKGRKQVKKTGFISNWDYFYTIYIQFFVALLPYKLRGWIFKQFLHKF